MYTKSNKSRHCYLYQFLKEKKIFPRVKGNNEIHAPYPET